jgi:hypothetical protein
MYDARVDGGFPAAPSPPPPCTGEGCRGPLSAPPAPVGISTETSGAVSEETVLQPEAKPKPKRHSGKSKAKRSDPKSKAKRSDPKSKAKRLGPKSKAKRLGPKSKARKVKIKRRSGRQARRGGRST